MLIFAALALVSLVQGCKNAIHYSQDFQWDAAKVLALRMNPYDLSLNPTDELKALGYEEYYMKMEANQFPSLLWLLFPFTLLGPLTARYAWLASNLILTALMLFLVYKTAFKGKEAEGFLLMALVMISGTPYRNQLGVGQHSVFSLAFFLLSVVFSGLSFQKKGVQKRIFTLFSILFLGVAFFKYTLTAPLTLYYVYKRRIHIPVMAAAAHVVLTFFSAFWLGDSFINMIKKPLQVAAWLTSEGSFDIGAVLGALFPGGASFSMAVMVLCMVLLLVYVLCMPEGFDIELLTVLALWSMVITYHRIYDYFVLALVAPGIYSLSGSKPKSPAFLFYLITTFVLFYVMRFFDGNPVFMIIAGSMYYILTVWMTVRLWKKRKK